MNNISSIGLNKEKSKELADLLNDLLANYSIFYQNVKGYHWNIKGNKFFELHLKFEELYNDLFIKIDDIAERVLTLGFEPEFRFTDFLEKSKILESKGVFKADKIVEELLFSLKVLLEKQRKVLKYSEEINDEGTNALMSDYIREQEKLVWMYSAYTFES
ncbi:Dps family protein [Maribacter litoralis]|uniref:Ferritin/DPS domain-containing protein n=1 Tax=Maribacter litoralis TaxID=2059726 RepID=A0A653XDM8_9FLAO|nr:DNA starvation/stationary phase protection protein [Maribacter litoralis]VXC28148.1 conserved hypothetical protein [Maribacter litoralis]